MITLYNNKINNFFMMTWGTFNFTGCQKVSTGSLFCQEVSNGTFSLTKEALYTGYKTHVAVTWCSYTIIDSHNVET
jgi:hypothetical protein